MEVRQRTPAIEWPTAYMMGGRSTKKHATQRKTITPLSFRQSFFTASDALSPGSWTPKGPLILAASIDGVAETD